MTTPKVSIIIPNYNHSKYLEQRIESVLNQTYQDFEVILMDDCSPDNSLNIINRYQIHPKVTKVLINETNSGSTFKQWNKGIKEAKGDYIWIAESDDYADNRFLEILCPFLEKNEAIGLVYCQSNKVDQDDNILGVWEYSSLFLNQEKNILDGMTFVKENMAISNFIPNASAVLFRKKVFDKIGGADTHFKICGDWMFWAKLALQANIIFVNEPLNFFRFHLNNVRSQIDGKKAYQEYMEVISYVFKYIRFNTTEKRKQMYSIIHYVMRLWFPVFNLKERIRFYKDVQKLDKYVGIKIIRTYLVLSFRQLLKKH
jgi:glycosyltransferase involved in cell wall biosynthesis